MYYNRLTANFTHYRTTCRSARF